MREELRRLALFTSGVAELTRNRAEKMVRDLVTAGELPGGQTSSLVKELVRRSQQNRKELMAFVRAEMRNQMDSLGVASKRDIERLERRVARLEDRAREARTPPARAGSGAKKTTAKKTSAKKTTAKKTSSRKSTAKKVSTAARPSDVKAPVADRGMGPSGGP